MRGLLGRAGRDEVDLARSERVTKVLELTERFVYDLGLVIAGEQVDMTEYVEPGCSERLHDAVRPALEAGAVTAPDFGEYAQVRIQGDLLDCSIPVWTVVEFDDRSTRLDSHTTHTHIRRRVRLQLLLDADIRRVMDHRIELVT